MSASEELKNRLLDIIQSGFPICRNPYAELASQLDTSEADVLEAVRNLYAEGSVRRIGASFDSRKLGYSSTLCALAVPGGEDELVAAAGIVSAYPGVTHNYGRANRYNLWFTLITRSVEEKERILSEIRQKTGCGDLLDMPASRMFKIRVDFGSGHRVHVKRASSAQSAEGIAPFSAESAFDVALVRWAQGDISRDAQVELVLHPFDEGARVISAQVNESVSAEDVVARIRDLKTLGVIRRFGAMVRHQRIGYAFNSMTVWDIPDGHVEEAGALFAAKSFVSHCYARPRMETWPANMYAMTHAQSEEEMSENIAELSRALEEAQVPCRAHFALTTTHEFKKVSMTYFA